MGPSFPLGISCIGATDKKIVLITSITNLLLNKLVR